MKFIIALIFLAISFSAANAKTQIQLWHQMIYSHRVVLKNLVEQFEKENPDINVQLTYRETEELRSTFQTSSMAGSGPEIVFGPSDQVGPFATMNLIRPIDDLFSADEKKEFDPLAFVKFQNKTYMIGSSVGNFLMLIYNKKIISEPPRDLETFIKLAQKNTKDSDNDGKIDQYGLVFNFTEPFFFVPWIDGYGEHFIQYDNVPNLNTPAVVKAFKLIQDFRDKYKIIPKECDYELANSLFKEGKAAMIINGDWSWGDYKTANIDFGIASFPMINETGLSPAPLVGTAGYSLNAAINSKEKLNASIKLIKFLTSLNSQLYFTKEISIFPSRYEARKSPLITQNDVLNNAASIMAIGKPMPVVPEVRAIWDSLRGPYQSVLAGTLDPKVAAENAQRETEIQIRRMNEILVPDYTLYLVYGLVFIVAMMVTLIVLKNFTGFFKDFSSNRFSYLMMLPAFVCIFSVIIYPFFYNVALSLSNFSLKTFSDWRLVGIQHYVSVLSDPFFYEIFFKTILWTLSNVFFHVSIGLLLAIIIEQVMPKKNLWRTLLIIPWAVPQYITALTWRGMFNQEYGPINLFLQHYLKLSPVQWLTQPWTTFSACVLTNVWLGFPFMMIVSLGALQSIPNELYESAKIDGANSWQRFKNITWPMIQPVLRPAALLGCIWTFNNLNVIWLVSNGGEPADQTHILVSYVYKAAFNLYRYGYAAALSMIIFFLLMGMTFTLQIFKGKTK